MNQHDTIAAIATPPGRGGVGIIRLSGKQSLTIAEQVLGFMPKPRYAHYCPFKDGKGGVIDEGIALYFPNPHSFTGEDVVEFQGHGGPVILDILLKEITAQGARLANPGEFSERAFMNDKLDLTQAEAIADLIDSASEQAARCALRSLQGEFSDKIHQLLDQLVNLRIYVEAAIDFPEEEIDFLADGKIQTALEKIMVAVKDVEKQTTQGTLIREGMKVVIAGKPNAGKSSLLNALAGRDTAIVTDIAGTTRDVLREHIHIDGMPLHIIDTAGLRDAPDEVERIGIKRAWDEIRDADRVLLVIDGTQSEMTHPDEIWPEFMETLGNDKKVTVIRNKCDLTGEEEGLGHEFYDDHQHDIIRLSVKQSATEKTGVEALRQHLKDIMGYDAAGEGGFIARRRHLDAIQRCNEALNIGHEQLVVNGAGELLAEDLREAQNALNEITGEFSSDDLLGKIFGSFCIGK